MIIALSKQLEIRDKNLNAFNVNHWLITDIVNRVSKDFAVVSIDGYANRQARLDGDAPIVQGARFKIKNTYDENGDIVINDYNKFIRYQSVTPDARHTEFLKEAVLEFLATTTQFSDATND